jgi:putative PIG3 family NAD(P)H quinone oxidoreductase
MDVRALPDTMTAIDIAQPGGPEELRPRTRHIPHIGPNDVLIQVAAAGINRPDILQRQGGYPPPAGVTDIPGLEVAGTVVAVGEQAFPKWHIGNAVCALVAGGGYAEYCAAPAGQCLPIPAGLSPVQAASLPETFFTVWSNLFNRAHLTRGETVLVHGGASGIGVAALQLATAFGARVIVTCGTDEKCAACLTLGAARAINYKTEDFVKEAKALTEGRGVDVVLDMVGGDYIARNIDVLAPEGRLVFIAFQTGVKAQINFLPIMTKRLTLTGSTLRSRDVGFKSAIARELENKVWPLISAGTIRPIIYETFPLSEAADAHRLLEEDRHIGKIVLTV